MSLINRLIGSFFRKSGKKKRSDAKTSRSKSRASSKPKVTTKIRAETHAAARSAFEIYRDSERCWLPPGKSTSIQGQFIPNGMIYVGDPIESVQGYRSVEPALINPKLSVNWQSPDRLGMLLSYWPSYSELAPESRAAYLDWLASGCGPGAPIGYVFLFFYGIERRILFDAKHNEIAKAEVPELLLEVERLLGLYSESSSFKRYASDLIVAAQCLYTELDPRFISPPMKRSGWEMPLSSRVALGKIVSSGQPLPPVWALSWLLTHPESRLRTPVNRCQSEFRSLFRVIYQNAYGDGILLKENKTRLRATYRAASAGLPQPISMDIGDLPDVSAVKGPHRQLQVIADEATTKLDPYSRWVGRTNDRHSLSALSLLPYEIADVTRSAVGQKFHELLEKSLGVQRERNTEYTKSLALLAGTRANSHQVRIGKRCRAHGATRLRD